jgi:phage shock protein C
MPSQKTTKRLVRGEDRKLFGVCAGVADYFNIDPVLVRVLWILVTAFSGFFPGIVVYLLVAWVMPEK